MNGERHCLIFGINTFKQWLHHYHVEYKDGKIPRNFFNYALGTKDQKTKFCLREHVKIFTIVDSLP
jgi:hypothetical protein